MDAGRSIIVRVPGSTSNCGSGFDSLGLALRLYNRVRLTGSDDGAIRGERPEDARAQPMVEATARALQARTGRGWAGGFVYRIDGNVPPARGLGSSVTVIAGVAAALDAGLGTGLGKGGLTALVTELEGHPDNAAAGVLGGFCVARCEPRTGAYVDTVRVAVPDEVAFVVASPAVEVLTKASRGVLPAILPYFDAVKSINSAAYLTAVFATRDYAKLRGAVHDFMHEPYRLPGITGGREAIAAGVEAGAYTGWLSGSGSSVLCVAPAAQAAVVGAAMRAAFGALGVPSEVRVLAADNDGLVVES